VAFPTETVYGLGGDARNPRAIERIYALKGRPHNHPVIVHVARKADLSQWARRVPGAARDLIERFWPGPLTLVLARAPGVLDAVTGGQDSVGLRCPAHPVAGALLGRLWERDPTSGLAAPSANRFGRTSATTAAHVRSEFGDSLFLLDGGPTAVGIESTILDLSRMDTEGPVLLRPGAIDIEQLSECLGILPRAPDAHAPRAPGGLAQHYAPRAKVRLVGSEDLSSVPAQVAVWSRSVAAPAGHEHWRTAPEDPGRYAHELYAVLRAFDDEGATEIWIEAPPKGVHWAAIGDRLARAAAG
jgi:L-threonylcarbamoyladenylate synthase